MKKQILFNLSFLLFACIAKAQFFPYYFTVIEEATYTNLNDSISLNQGQIWDDPEYIIDLGFEFDYFDTLFDSIVITGTTTIIFPFSTPQDTVAPLLIPYTSDIIDIGDTSGVASVSEVSYKIEGMPGSQIAKIEWKNVGFYNEVSGFGTANNYLSFQLWFYEGSNDIEIHFGPNNIEDDNLVHDFLGKPGLGMVTGYNFNLDEFAEFWYLTGNQQNPTIDTIFSVDDIYTSYTGLDDDPANGTIYRFSTSPPNATVDPVVDHYVNVFPNPANEYINIVVDGFDWEVFNITLLDVGGRNILNKEINTPVTKIDINHLPRGVYLLHVQTTKGITTKKITKS